MSDTTPLAGVIGWPIHHSRSPRLHGHWLARYDLPGHYIPMAVAPEDLKDVLGTLPKLGFRGINVTLPHKEVALDLATEVTEEAARIGAANTLTFLPGGGYCADNTDAYGFLENLKAGAPKWQPKDTHALVLGAGGAARAILIALLDAGVAQIHLANRTMARAEKLAANISPRITPIAWEDLHSAIPTVKTIVNTTSLGMDGQPPLPLSLDSATPETLVTDIVYTPLITPLLQDAQARGLPVVDGLGMLLHQAVPGFATWFGHTPLVDAQLRGAVLR